MSRLFLHCGLCGRKQADGLLSRAHWGHVDGGSGQSLSACPSCKQHYSDWSSRLLASTTGSPAYGASYGLQAEAAG